MMEPLNLPPAKLNLSRKGEQVVVWCIIRKKHLVLTPEEWVRQHAIHFLLNERQIPIGRINSEHLVQINGQARRCDIVVFSEFGKPVLIVECKATSIAIDEKTFLQTSNYVQQLQAPYFWMTNGLQHVMMDCRNPGVYLSELPALF
ncbi:MAG: type I restriction enzyme HsdR N-terminal domain-containing protein [Fluviicola sp.]|nr:type I restriction enzyme HsdR N-terminal domain-containing protein [Fluviicola sp.]